MTVGSPACIACGRTMELVRRNLTTDGPGRLAVVEDWICPSWHGPVTIGIAMQQPAPDT